MQVPPPQAAEQAADDDSMEGKVVGRVEGDVTGLARLFGGRYVVLYLDADLYFESISHVKDGDTGKLYLECPPLPCLCFYCRQNRDALEVENVPQKDTERALVPGL